jgi:hypothetical protein
MGRAATESGSSVEAFTATLEAFRRKARETGSDGWMRGFTNIKDDVWKTLDGAQLEAFINGVNAKNPGVPGSVAYASNLATFAAGGVGDEKTIQAVLSPDYHKKVADNESMSKATGLAPEQAAKDSAEFLSTMRKFGYQLDAIWQDIESKVVHEHGAELKKLLDWFSGHSDEIAKALTDIALGLVQAAKATAEFVLPLDKAVKYSIGWKNALEGIAAALLLKNTRLGVLAALNMPVWLVRLLGLTGTSPAGIAAAQLYGSQGELGVDPNSPIGSAVIDAQRAKEGRAMRKTG